jgi:hypothetical protein
MIHWERARQYGVGILRLDPGWDTPTSQRKLRLSDLSSADRATLASEASRKGKGAEGAGKRGGKGNKDGTKGKGMTATTAPGDGVVKATRATPVGLTASVYHATRTSQARTARGATAAVATAT